MRHNLIAQITKIGLIIVLFLIGTICNVSAQERPFSKEEIAKIKKKANKGDAHALYLLGSCYLEGSGIKEDWHEGYDCLTASANQNYVPALYKLGILLFIKHQYESAEKNLRKALNSYKDEDSIYVEKEDICTALYKLAVYYATGDNKETSFETIDKKMNPKALNLFEYLSEFDDEALELLIYHFYEKDNGKAYKYALEGYRRKLYTSGLYLGEMYNYGYGVKKDLDKAIQYYEFPANSKDFSNTRQVCRERLVEICYEMKNWDKAFKYSYDYAHDKWFNNNDTADILHVLASCYRFGRSTEKNIILADIWDLIAILYCDDDKAEVMGSYWDIDINDHEKLYLEVLSRLKNGLESKMGIKQNEHYEALMGIYYINVKQNFKTGQDYLVKAYNRSGSSKDTRVYCAYILKSLKDLNKNIMYETSNNIINNFEDEEGLSFDDLNKLIINDCFINICIECIKTIE